MDAETNLPDDLIESKQAARIAKAHIASVYRWVLSGKIRGWRRCGRLFVSKAEVIGLFSRVRTRKEEAGPKRPRSNDAWCNRVLKRAGIICR